MIDPMFQFEELRGRLSMDNVERCQYPSKVCRNRRTLKKNNELHRFCDDHRAKANKNQKRWAQSRHRRCGNESPAATTPRKPQRAGSPASSTTSEPASPQESAKEGASFTEMLRPYAWLGPKDEFLSVDDEQLSVFLQDLLWPSEETQDFDKLGAASEAYEILML